MRDRQGTRGFHRGEKDYTRGASSGVYQERVHSADGVSSGWCERLYDAKAAQLLLYGRALGLGHGEAEDVLHEVFRELIERRAQPAEPEFYVLRAFRNRALNFKRGLWRRLTRELESTRWFERDGDRNAAEQAAMRGLAKLPVEQREVIVLKIWHGLTFDSIGELLEVSPNTAAGRYRYGMQKLRTFVENDTYESLGDTGEPIAWVPAAPPVPEG